LEGSQKRKKEIREQKTRGVAENLKLGGAKGGGGGRAV